MASNLRANGRKVATAEAFERRGQMRSRSFDTMLESVREYPDVLEVVGGKEQFDRILEPGKALWEKYLKLLKKNPFIRFAIVPYAINAQETLAYGCEVIECFPKCDLSGSGYGQNRSICSPSWLHGEWGRFPELLVRYYAKQEVPRGLRCEIISLFPKPADESLPPAHMGVLFGYEQDDGWIFSRESHWRERIMSSGDTAIPPLTLGLDVRSRGIRVLPTIGQDFPKPGIYPDATGKATWHRLWLRLGATKYGEYMRFDLSEDNAQWFVTPVIVETT